jgi:nucleotide-binding universal stress UspA family protein
MSFKTIAVHLDDGPRCPIRIALAATLAARFEGKLVGIVPTGVPDAILSMDTALPDGLEVVALSLAHLRERAEATARAFDTQCRALGVPAESRLVVEEALDAVVEHGRCSDLIMVGQTDRNRAADGVAFDFPQQVLLHAGPPILIVPYASVFASVGQDVLVGWKGTRESANALRNALPLLRSAQRVSLVEVAEAPDLAAGDGSLVSAKAWLESHGVKVRAHRELALASVGDQLLSRAADIGADLIVCGGYGHSRLREWMLGGVTRHLLDHMTVPVLFSH